MMLDIQFKRIELEFCNSKAARARHIWRPRPAVFVLVPNVRVPNCEKVCIKLISRAQNHLELHMSIYGAKLEILIRLKSAFAKDSYQLVCLSASEDIQENCRCL